MSFNTSYIFFRNIIFRKVNNALDRAENVMQYLFTWPGEKIWLGLKWHNAIKASKTYESMDSVSLVSKFQLHFCKTGNCLLICLT